MNMTTEIIIKNELRPCKVIDYYGNYKNALFHKFTDVGNAIVECEDGTVTTYDATDVTFLDNEFENYSFEPQPEDK